MAKKQPEMIIEKIPVNEILVENRGRKDFSKVTDLKNSMKRIGLQSPIKVNKITTDETNEDGTQKIQYNLIYGETRLRAAKELKWETIDAIVTTIDDEEKLLEIEIAENEARQDFAIAERTKLAMKFEEMIAAKARDKSRKNLKKGNDSPSVQILTLGETEETPQKTMRTDTQVANRFKIGSKTQYRKCKEIVEHESDFDPEDFEKWNSGKISTNKMYNKLKPPTKKHTPPFLKETKEEILKEELKQIDTLPQGFPDTLPSLEAGAQGRINAFCEIILGQFMDWITVYKELFIQDLQSLPLEEKKRISEECFEPVVKELKNKHLAVKSVIASEENKNKPMRKMTQKELDNMKTTLPEEQKKGNWMNEEELKKATEYYANPTLSQKEEEFKKEWDRELTNVLGPNYQNDPDNYD